MPEKGKGGRPPLEITDLMRRQTKRMAELGLTQAEACQVLEISEPTLQRRLGDEFKAGLEKRHAGVAQNLVRIAMDREGLHPGPTVTAAIFYLKTRCGWRETQHVIHGFDPSVVREFVLSVLRVIREVSAEVKGGLCAECKIHVDLQPKIAARLKTLSDRMAATLPPSETAPAPAPEDAG